MDREGIHRTRTKEGEFAPVIDRDNIIGHFPTFGIKNTSINACMEDRLVHMAYVNINCKVYDKGHIGHIRNNTPALPLQTRPTLSPYVAVGLNVRFISYWAMKGSKEANEHDGPLHNDRPIYNPNRHSHVYVHEKSSRKNKRVSQSSCRFSLIRNI